MASIVLHDGTECFIDEEDLELVSQFKWYNPAGYARTTYHRKGSSKTDKNRNVNVYLHRLVMGALDGEMIDHIDRNPMNNRKSNLRKVSHSVNMANSVKQKGANPTSSYVGVQKCRGTHNTYYARVAGEVIGYYKGEKAAAQARDLAMIKHYGTTALTLNFKVEELPESVQALPPKPNAGRTSEHKGVSYARGRKAQARWRAIHRSKHLGWFMTEEEAVAAMQEKLDESN